MSNLLYKYLDVNGAIMMLHYSNLMYANAMMFNDPFDCHPSLIDIPFIETTYGYVVYLKYTTQY